jgi:hypothetical protein
LPSLTCPRRDRAQPENQRDEGRSGEYDEQHDASQGRHVGAGIGAVTEPLVDSDADGLDHPEDQPGSGEEDAGRSALPEQHGHDRQGGQLDREVLNVDRVGGQAGPVQEAGRVLTQIRYDEPQPGQRVEGDHSQDERGDAARGQPVARRQERQGSSSALTSDHSDSPSRAT